jgi:hypothetical protein
MAARFWVGGTGTWDSTATTNWAATSGGASGASAPVTADTVTFDGSSGGGTVTVDATVSGLSLGSITCGAFTGTIDFSAISALTITGTFSVTGSGTRTVTLGSATYTLSGVNVNNWDCTTTTNLTLSAASATFSIITGGAQGQNFVGGGQSYGTLSFGARSQIGKTSISGANTFANLSITPSVVVSFPPSVTTTITNAINWAGSSSALFYIDNGNSAGAATISLGATPTAVSWGAFKAITFAGAGSGFTATNSFSLGGLTGASVTGPSSGGGAKVIGG